jgi:EAL domain-containing protein (putative c-di-GMP-specific phosphodiesterase class I)
VSEVKIDKSFLQPGQQTASSLAIVAAIVDLGHRLDRRVVAEGVEDEATWQHLQQLGCDSAQGYWMGRPMPVDEFLPWLKQWRPLEVAALRALA